MEKTRGGNPLLPFDGEVPAPCWSLRPGGVEALQKLAPALGLWLLIRSSNGKRLKPCLASRGTLAATLQVSERKLGSLLASLRARPGLLLEIRRPPDRASGRRRPPLRFAVDPLRWWRERPLIEGQLPGLAEAAGLSARWLRAAGRVVERFDVPCRRMAHEISAEVYPQGP